MIRGSFFERLPNSLPVDRPAERSLASVFRACLRHARRAPRRHLLSFRGTVFRGSIRGVDVCFPAARSYVRVMSRGGFGGGGAVASANSGRRSQRLFVYTEAAAHSAALCHLGAPTCLKARARRKFVGRPSPRGHGPAQRPLRLAGEARAGPPPRSSQPTRPRARAPGPSNGGAARGAAGGALSAPRWGAARPKHPTTRAPERALGKISGRAGSGGFALRALPKGVARARRDVDGKAAPKSGGGRPKISLDRVGLTELGSGASGQLARFSMRDVVAPPSAGVRPTRICSGPRHPAPPHRKRRSRRCSISQPLSGRIWRQLFRRTRIPDAGAGFPTRATRVGAWCDGPEVLLGHWRPQGPRSSTSPLHACARAVVAPRPVHQRRDAIVGYVGRRRPALQRLLHLPVIGCDCSCRGQLSQAFFWGQSRHFGAFLGVTMSAGVWQPAWGFRAAEAMSEAGSASAAASLRAPSLLSAALLMPGLAERRKLCESCRTFARHTCRRVTASEPGELRSCPAVAGTLSKGCSGNRESTPHRQIWPRSATM